MKSIRITAAALAIMLALLAFASCTPGKPETTTVAVTTEAETTEAVTTEAVTTEAETTAADTAEETAQDGRLVFEGISIELPAGFTTTESVTSGQKVITAVPPEYPAKSDNITLTSGVDKVDNYTKESLQLMYDQIFGAGAVTDLTVTRDKFGDLDRVIITYNVTVNGSAMKQKSCNYFSGDKVVVITFTDVTGSYVSEFDAAYESIQKA